MFIQQTNDCNGSTTAVFDCLKHFRHPNGALLSHFAAYQLLQDGDVILHALGAGDQVFLVEDHGGGALNAAAGSEGLALADFIGEAAI